MYAEVLWSSCKEGNGFDMGAVEGDVTLQALSSSYIGLNEGQFTGCTGPHER